MENEVQRLRDCLMQNAALVDEKSILSLLYKAYSEKHRLDDQKIKDNFNELYRAMNGMDLKTMDTILYPVCTLCRDHERAGFIEGIKLGVILAHELSGNLDK